MSAPAGTVLRHDAAAPATPERAFDWHTLATDAKYSRNFDRSGALPLVLPLVYFMMKRLSR